MTKEKEMTKYELIDEIAEKACCTKLDARNMLNAFIDTVTEQLVQGNKIKLIGFGTFEVRDRKGREGRNPRTNEPIQIEASKAPAFKAGKQLKDAVNQ